MKRLSVIQQDCLHCPCQHDAPALYWKSGTYMYVSSQVSLRTQPHWNALGLCQVPWVLNELLFRLLFTHKPQRISEYLWWQIRNRKTTCAEMSRFVRYTYNSTLFPEIMALYGCLFVSSLLSGYANQYWHMTSTVRVLMHSKLPSRWRNTSLIVVSGFPLRLSPQCGLSGVS